MAAVVSLVCVVLLLQILQRKMSSKLTETLFKTLKNPKAKIALRRYGPVV